MCWHQSNNWSGLKLNSELDSAVQNALTGPPVSDVPKEVTMHMRVFRLNTEKPHGGRYFHQGSMG